MPFRRGKEWERQHTNMVYTRGGEGQGRVSFIVPISSQHVSSLKTLEQCRTLSKSSLNLVVMYCLSLLFSLVVHIKLYYRTLVLSWISLLLVSVLSCSQMCPTYFAYHIWSLRIVFYFSLQQNFWWGRLEWWHRCGGQWLFRAQNSRLPCCWQDKTRQGKTTHHNNRRDETRRDETRLG